MPSTMTECTQCGTANDVTNQFCGNCGTKVPRPLKCAGCGGSRIEGQAFCGVCGEAAGTPSPALSSIRSRPPSEHALSDLSSYYKDEFTSIRDSGESYKGKWNWAAFFFGGFWAITKGLWLPTVICFVAAICTGGVGGFVYCFLFGARGNYMYYCKQVKQKDIPV